MSPRPGKRSGVLELAVLGLLQETPMHGYELRKRLSAVLGTFHAISYGSLYPCLKDLEARGLIVEDGEAARRGRRRCRASAAGSSTASPPRARSTSRASRRGRARTRGRTSASASGSRSSAAPTPRRPAAHPRGSPPPARGAARRAAQRRWPAPASGSTATPSSCSSTASSASSARSAGSTSSSRASASSPPARPRTPPPRRGTRRPPPRPGPGTTRPPTVFERGIPMGSVRVAIVGVGNCAVVAGPGRRVLPRRRPDRQGPRPDARPVRPVPRQRHRVRRRVRRRRQEGRPRPRRRPSSPARTTPSRSATCRRPASPCSAATPSTASASTTARRSPSPTSQPVDVVAALRDAQVDVLVCYLPVGSEAGREVLRPVRHRRQGRVRQRAAGLHRRHPGVGAEVRPTPASRSSATTSSRRSARPSPTACSRSCSRTAASSVDRTYQLNVGGNMDFMNMLERERLESKKISKTQSVTSQLVDGDLGERNVHIGPSDYVAWLDDRKWAFVRLEGRRLRRRPAEPGVQARGLGLPELAPASSSTRCARAKIAKDRGIGGPILSASSVLHEVARRCSTSTTQAKAGRRGLHRRRDRALSARVAAQPYARAGRTLLAGPVRRCVRPLRAGDARARRAGGGAHRARAEARSDGIPSPPWATPGSACARSCASAGSGCCSARGCPARPATACSRRSLATFVLFSPERPADRREGRGRVRRPAAAVLADRPVRRRAPRPVAAPRRPRATPTSCAARSWWVSRVIVATGHDDALLAVWVLVVLGVNRFILAALSAGLPHVVADRYLVTGNALAPTAGTIASVVGGVARGGAPPRSPAAATTARSSSWRRRVLLYLLAVGRREPPGPAPARTGRLDRARVAPRDRRRAWSRACATWPSGDPPRAPSASSWCTASIFGIVSRASPCSRSAGRCTRATPTPRSTRSTLATGAAGLGALLGAVVTPRTVAAARGRCAGPRSPSSSASRSARVGAGRSEPAGLLVEGFFVGFAGQAVKVCSDTIVQEDVDDDRRGRVFALYDVAVNVAIVAGLTAAAFAAPPDGNAPLGRRVDGRARRPRRRGGRSSPSAATPRRGYAGDPGMPSHSADGSPLGSRRRTSCRGGSTMATRGRRSPQGTDRRARAAEGRASAASTGAGSPPGSSSSSARSCSRSRSRRTGGSARSPTPSATSRRSHPLAQDPTIKQAVAAKVTDVIVTQLDAQARVSELLQDYPRLQPLSGPIASGVNSLVARPGRPSWSTATSSTSSGSRINTQLQKALVAALSGEPVRRGDDPGRPGRARHRRPHRGGEAAPRRPRALLRRQHPRPRRRRPPGRAADLAAARSRRARRTPWRSRSPSG